MTRKQVNYINKESKRLANYINHLADLSKQYYQAINNLCLKNNVNINNITKSDELIEFEQKLKRSYDKAKDLYNELEFIKNQYRGNIDVSCMLTHYHNMRTMTILPIFKTMTLTLEKTKTISNNGTPTGYAADIENTNQQEITDNNEQTPENTTMLQGGLYYCHYTGQDADEDRDDKTCIDLNKDNSDFYVENETEEEEQGYSGDNLEAAAEYKRKAVEEAKKKTEQLTKQSQQNNPKTTKYNIQKTINLDSEEIIVNEIYNYIQTHKGQVPNTKITNNISWQEMLGNNNTDSERQEECTKEILTNIYRTATQLQKIHDMYWKGRPLIISSGWRSIRNNKSCGGASKSKHLYGQAVDFHLGINMINNDFKIMEKYWKGFVLHEGTWIHADIR